VAFFIHFSPESIFTSRRNPYSHRSGTIIHMPRNPHNAVREKIQKHEVNHGKADAAIIGG